MLYLKSFCTCMWMKYVTLLVFIWNKIAWKCFRVVGLMLFFFFPCSPGESLFIISKKILKKSEIKILKVLCGFFSLFWRMVLWTQRPVLGFCPPLHGIWSWPFAGLNKVLRSQLGWQEILFQDVARENIRLIFHRCQCASEVILVPQC